MPAVIISNEWNYLQDVCTGYIWNQWFFLFVFTFEFHLPGISWGVQKYSKLIWKLTKSKIHVVLRILEAYSSAYTDLNLQWLGKHNQVKPNLHALETGHGPIRNAATSDLTIWGLNTLTTTLPWPFYLVLHWENQIFNFCLCTQNDTTHFESPPLFKIALLAHLRSESSVCYSLLVACESPFACLFSYSPLIGSVITLPHPRMESI